MSAEFTADDFTPVEFTETTDVINEGKAVVTLKFKDAVSITSISFVNSYTASVSLTCYNDTDSKWIGVGDAIKLMPHPHYIDGAQDTVTIETARTSRPAAFENIHKMQLILKQPSPHWLKFGVNELVCFARHNETTTTPKALDEHLAAEIEHLHGLVAKTAALVRAHACEYERFEVDGQYDIKTLSLP